MENHKSFSITSRMEYKTMLQKQTEAFEEYREYKRIAQKYPGTSPEHHVAMSIAKAALKRYKKLGGVL